MSNKIIEAEKSSKISIRPYKPSDLDDFMIYYDDNNVTRFTSISTFKSCDEALSFMKASCIPHPFCRSICYNDCSIGYISITPELSDDRAEMSGALAAEYWGQGIAVKMAMCGFSKEFSHVVRLEAIIVVENKGSQRVMEKLGFFREGIVKNFSYVMVILEML